MSDLRSVLESLSIKALKWVLAGVMTLDEADYAMVHSRLTHKRIRFCMSRRHGARTSSLAKSNPEILEGLAVFDSQDEIANMTHATHHELIDRLVREYGDMHEDIQVAFFCGGLTFIEARYAHRRKIVGERLRCFVDINRPRVVAERRARHRAEAEERRLKRQYEYVFSLFEEGRLLEVEAKAFLDYGTDTENIDIYLQAMAEKLAERTSLLVA